jgi:hypothetical protein
MGRMSREKGARGEREAAHFWSRVFPECRRRSCGEESQTAQGRDLAETPGYCIQVKHMARPDEHAALHEAIMAARDGEIPLAHCRRVLPGNGRTIYAATVTLRATDARILVAVFERFRLAFPSRVDELRIEMNGDGTP